MATIAETSYPVDNLGIENEEVVQRTIKTGQGVLVRGTALTLTTGKLVKTVADGAIHSVLKQDVDTTAADVVADVYYTGRYKRSVIETATGITITEAMEDTMRSNQLTLG